MSGHLTARQAAGRVLLGLTIAGWVYTVVSSWLVHRFLRPAPEGREAPRSGPGGDRFAPPVSIAKPVHGIDYGAAETFAALLEQDYPQYEVLFAVADPGDPAVTVIEEARLAHPGIPTRLLVSTAGRPNPKVALLEALVDAADHDVIVMADSDVRVRPDYLSRVTAPLVDPSVGLVTCLYRGTAAHSLAARLQALYLNVGFLPSVVLGRIVLRGGLGLGATIVMRRDTIERIGGLAAVSDYLADDYQLGARTVAVGMRAELAPYVVELPLGALTLRDLWKSEVRWVRCTRVSRPVEFPGLLLTLPVPPALLWWLTQPRRRGWAWLVPGATILLRYATAWLVTGSTRDRALRRWLPLLPLRDLLSVLVVFAAAFGRTVEWRGKRYLVMRDGRIVGLPSGGSLSRQGRTAAAPLPTVAAPPVPTSPNPTDRGGP